MSPPVTQERVAEWNIESQKSYADPFNDVDVDVIFTRGDQSWRVPTFWRGGQRWTVRFAPPAPGSYSYHLESTDKSNPDLNGHSGRIKITTHSGSNPLFRHGGVRVSPNKRYFEHADGTPFFWLGDTWWAGLSDRLPWEGFTNLTADRRAKGFTVVQIVAGLVPDEEAPPDPGFCNEGGCVWDSQFKQLNPKYFDYADRRIQYLVDHGLVPAIVGGWRYVLPKIGVARMKKHWRYIIARYGAYPVFWLGGGEVFDPPPEVERKLGSTEWFKALKMPGWTEVVRYIRATDPYHHPLAVHGVDPPFDSSLQDESLTDFELFQAGHRGWPSIATEIALLNKYYARTTVTKPLVVGEIGYEKQVGENYEDYQRAAFWLAMLNGAAGFTYGNISMADAYRADQPFHRTQLSLYTWDEAMHFPGATQIAIGAALLKQYPWWEISPHPEWVTPRGTTLLEPNDKGAGFNIDMLEALAQKQPPSDDELPLGEWHDVHGNWRLPYAAGVSGEVRFIYLPHVSYSKGNVVPRVLGLEPGIRYHAYYWQPDLGVKYDLGVVERVANGDGKVDVEHLDRQLYDASGQHRGELRGAGWDEYGKHQQMDRAAYQPEKPPMNGDWLLVLEARK
jgi:hypothetical protein